VEFLKMADDEKPSRRSRKSENAYRTISEVAGEIDVPAHVLRFWETKFPSVKPLKRGGGRRYYRPEDIDALRRIRNLLYEDGLTIRGVQKLLKTHGGKPPAGIASETAPSVATPAPAAVSPPVEAVGEPQLDFGLSSRQIDQLREVLDDLRGMRSTLSAAA
jgi:DNA-binding transcriptional MerR regulator